MKSLFTCRTLFILCLFLTFQLRLLSQSISGSTTICPGTGTVRYTFNNLYSCSNLQWDIQGGPVSIINTVNNYIDLQFPSVPADVTYRVNVGYVCTNGNGSTSLNVLVKKGPTLETRSATIPCSFQGDYTFQADVEKGSWKEVQWSTNTGWVSGSQWTTNGQVSNLEISNKAYGVNNLGSGYVKAVVLGVQCNNAPIYELTYNVTRSSDLPALAFTSSSVAGLCGTSSGTVSVTPPAQAPSGYRWYSVPANALKINGGSYSSAGAPLTTTTPSVTIQPAAAQNGVATLYVSAVYPGGCGTTWSSREISLAPSLPAAPTVTSTRLSAPGEPTEYLFTATSMTNVIYDWYLSNGTLVQSGAGNTFQEYFPCMVSRTYYCIVRNSCGSSAPSNSVTRTGGCRDDRAAATVFSISPNPASNVVSIGVKNNTSAKSSTTPSVASFTEVIIYDFSGNPVKRQQYADVKQGTIDIGNLRTGTYYIEIKNGRIAEKQTLIIQQ